MDDTTIRAAGVGSWPGEDAREAQRIVRDLLADGHVPYLPELPARGAGADMIGRTAAQLVGLPVDLQPSGWRFADARDRDARRGRSLLRHDLDDLAETYDGYDGPLKVQLAGPLTLGAAVRLGRGERALTDRGALRDLVQSLAETAVSHVADCRRLVPGAHLILQLDEPGLPSVLAGSLPTSSGFGTIPALDEQQAQDVVTQVVRPLSDQGVDVVIHCCASPAPLELLPRVSSARIGLDTAGLTSRGWDAVAADVDAAGAAGRWWFGLVPTDSRAAHPRDHVQPFADAWHRTGLTAQQLRGCTLTPACGLAGGDPRQAQAITRLTRDAAAMATEVAEGMSPA